MAPEETSLINPSSLCKFRKLRLKDNDLMNLLIEKTVSIAVEKGDGPQLEELVKQSRENGMEVETVVGDTAYSGKENIILSQNEDTGFELVARLHPTISHGFRKKEDEFDFNKDAGMFVCPAGHMAIRKARQGKKNQGENQTMTYYFDVENR